MFLCMCIVFSIFFFFKQKTSYEMRISDWSSDVCSSDLYYNWSGQPWKTQALVRKILDLTYGSDAAGYGYPGMDDQGATSSWYMLSAMGFYPVDPSSQDYILGSPVFDAVSLDMGNGKKLRIVAQTTSPATAYIQRSEERREGKDCVSTSRSTYSPNTNKK